MRHFAHALVFSASLFAAGVASAQQAPRPRETLQIGLSTDTIAITSGFSGADLTIFGAIENLDAEINRQGQYDIVAVLEGPSRDVTVRRKDRIAGIWINRQSAELKAIPVSYSVATTRPIRDIAPDTVFRQLGLGIDYLPIPENEQAYSGLDHDEASNAFRDIKLSSGLYNVRDGGVRFLSANLFRASVALAANVPVGTHTARAFLFRNGVFLTEVKAPLIIVKSGAEAAIFNASRNQSLAFGLFAVALAILTGWLGRLVFKRD
ncbi:MAG: TIGR02186 family protein [Notoacmeibacter sp.]|nr:TIGR02186 family protein [Notoacmeibacter sp.]MCC0033364.1 TIGR02186 family protein [Brucellaceae bacterium]